MNEFTGLVEEANGGESTANQKPVLPPDAGEEEKELFEMLMAGFGEKKTIAEVTEDEWKKMNASEHVVTSGKNIQVDTAATKANQDKEELMASFKAGRILYGQIVGVRSANKDRDIATYLAEIKFGHDTFRVFIPAYELYVFSVRSKTTKTTEMSVNKVLIDMIGAEVPFIVSFINLADKTVYASRLAAMQRIGKDNYIQKKSNGKPRVTVGSVVEARIVAVKTHAVILDVLGSETVITAVKSDNELSWDRIEDCTQVFRVNDMLPVRVLSVEPKVLKRHKNEYNLIVTTVSHKATTSNPMEQYWDTIEEGEIGLAEITGVMNGSVFCKYKGRVSILCSAPQHGYQAVVGMTRPVKITKKQEDEKGKRIFGVFTN